MANKDINKPTTKTSLMDELKSIKGVLNTDDDNIPLLLDDEVAADEDIPVLASDDDIPVLTAPDETTDNQASLDAAIRQLESMQLSPRASKTRPDDKATTVRENPFMAKKPADLFAESRKQADQALMSVIAHSKAMSSPAKPAPAKEEAQPKPAQVAAEPVAARPAELSAAVEEDASADILKLLDDHVDVAIDLGSDFGELVDIDVDALINEKPAAQKTTAAVAPPPRKQSDAQIDAIIDEVVEEYMVILEAALRKKLKEKLPDLLKK